LIVDPKMPELGTIILTLSGVLSVVENTPISLTVPATPAASM